MSDLPGVRSRLVSVLSVLAVVLGLVVLTQSGPLVSVSLPPPDTVPGPAAASRLAKQVNQKILVEEQTTETSETHANPDGTYTLTTHLRPVRVRQGGRWVAADPKLSRRPDGLWAANATVAETTLSGARKGQGAPLLQLSKDGMATGLDWLGDLPEPVVNGATATYLDVLPGVDLKVESGVDAVYEVVVIKTPEAARNLAKLTMGIPVRDLTVTQAEDGSLHARDAKGEEVFSAKAPRMWDSSGVSGSNLVRGPAPGGRGAKVAATLAGDRITLEPDANLLNARDAVFPLYVDPTWQPVYCGACGRNHYLVQYACGSGKVPGDTQWDNDDQLRVGFIGDGTATCDGSLVTARSFVEMNIPGLYGKEIYGAQLNLAVNNSKSCVGTNNVHLVGVIGGVPRFNAGPPIYDYLGTVGDGRNCPTNVGFDVTGSVQKVVDGRGTTWTFGILSPNENDINTWKRYSTQVGFAITYNSPPNPVQNLQIYNGTRGYPCAQGTNRPVLGRTSTNYIGKANISDPDGQMLYGGFRIYKVAANGDYAWDKAESGMDNVPSDPNPAHQNVHAKLTTSSLTKDGVYALDVHATDGRATVWVKPCEFELQLSAPTAPKVVSDSYPSGGWGGGPGQSGRFTFTVPSSPTSINRYVWRLDNTANPSCNGTELGTTPANQLNGPGVATIAPPSKGAHVLSVWSCNRAQTPSSRVDYRFNVNDSSPPVASWQFEDGLTSANSGMRYAGEGLGIFTEGKIDDAVTLSGQTGDYLASPTKVVAISESFTVSAWARLADTNDDHVVLSQDGVDRSGFTLRYDKTLGKWAFGLPTADNGSATTVNAVSTAAPVVGEWVHLTGVYDAGAKNATLYVNGQSQQTSAVTGVAVHGPFLIGVGKKAGARSGLFAGAIDEVVVVRRALAVAEVTTLFANNGVPTGLPASREYKLDDDTTDATGTEGTLRPAGAAVFGTGYSDSPATSATERRVGQKAGRALVLNKAASVQTDDPVIDTTRGYTISAWAKLTDLAGDYAIAGQNGARATPFQLRYAKNGNQWQMGISSGDADAENYRWATSTSPAKAGVWTHLTGVHDPSAGKVLLYVNGVLESQTAIPTGVAWQSHGRFTVGRALAAAEPTALFNGSLDQVQVWDRVLAGPEVTGLANTAVARANLQLSNGDSTNVPQTSATWNLDDSGADTSGNNASLTLSGDAAWVPGKSGSALQLGGTGIAEADGPVIDTSKSFSVSAWVKLADLNGSYPVAGVEGEHASGFNLGYSTDSRRWMLGMPSADADDPTWAGYRWATSTTVPQAGVWTHLTGAYDTDAGLIQLYVNGALESQAVIPPGTAWQAGGPFVLGRYKHNSEVTAPFKGGIDQVRVFGQTVDADQAAALAGVTRDKVTGAVGVPSGQVWLTDGSANVAKFDRNAMGQIAVQRPQNFRADGSFTVEAWVKHTWTAADEQDRQDTNGVDPDGRAAIGVDDPAFSPFMLGYRGVKDANGTWQGRWSWLLIRADAKIGAPQGWTMTSSEAAQNNTWTHLTGTYDAATHTACLYAASDGKQFTPSCLTGVTVWAGTNPASNLLIGRGAFNGDKSDRWHGPVRGVRVYSGVLDSQQISADRVVDHP
jgi:hypothetical protein